MARAGVAQPSEALSTPDTEVPAWSRSWQDVGEKLGVDPNEGLSEQEAGQRWSRQAQLEELPALLQQIQAAGHSVLSITPRLTLEKIFLMANIAYRL